MRRLLGLLMMVVASPLALAHEGHGLGLHHWHASDAFGFLVFAVAIALVLWASRRK